MKRYKVMAYVKSTGLWDTLGHLSLEAVLGFKDEDLETALKEWHEQYDHQFKRHPYAFNWKQFNKTGEELTRKIRAYLPPDTDVYYEPSDDREFFSRKDCTPPTSELNAQDRERSLREWKKALLYAEIGECKP